MADETAEVDFGGGIVKTVVVAVDGLNKGDYVVVHAGVVVSKISRQQFLETFTKIHKITEELVKKGEISQQEAETLFNKGFLASSGE